MAMTNKGYHANAVAGGGDANLQRLIAEKGGPSALDTSTNYSSAWWNANDAYNKAQAAGDFAGMVSAKETMDRAHKSQNDFYKSLGINYNTNPGLYDNLSVRPEAQMRDLGSLANMYGITTDEQEILNKYLSLVDAQYATKRREYAQAENDWYSNMATISADNVSALRKTYDNAVASGASSGLVAASILGEQLGLTQDTIGTATELANKRFNLIDQEAEARAQAALDAFNDSQSIKTTLGQLASQIYASDVQKDVAWWDREAQLDANDATRNAATTQALSSWLTGKNAADVELELGYLEDDYNRYRLGWEAAQNELNRTSQENMNKEDNATERYVSDNNLKSTEMSIAGNKEVANINANSYKGGSSGNYSGGNYSNNNGNNSGDLEFDEAWQKGIKLANTSGKYYEALAMANQLSPILGMEAWEIMRKWNPNFGKKTEETPKTTKQVSKFNPLHKNVEKMIEDSKHIKVTTNPENIVTKYLKEGGGLKLPYITTD